jgi:hypothetical protein
MDQQTNPATETPWQRRVRFLKSQSDAIYAAESAKVSARMRDVDRAREELELAEAKLSVAKIESARRIHEAQDELCRARQEASTAPTAKELDATLNRMRQAAGFWAYR